MFIFSSVEIRPHMNLDPRLQKLDNSGIALPQAEVDALVAFLKTLTDQSLLTDPKYSDPLEDKR
jgi:cytochrome c peroxidase